MDGLKAFDLLVNYIVATRRETISCVFVGSSPRLLYIVATRRVAAARR